MGVEGTNNLLLSTEIEQVCLCSCTELQHPCSSISGNIFIEWTNFGLSTKWVKWSLESLARGLVVPKSVSPPLVRASAGKKSCNCREKKHRCVSVMRVVQCGQVGGFDGKTLTVWDGENHFSHSVSVSFIRGEKIKVQTVCHSGAADIKLYSLGKRWPDFFNSEGDSWVDERFYRVKADCKVSSLVS